MLSPTFRFSNTLVPERFMSAPISLVTTVYNRQQYLAATIESILAQTHRDLEYVLWDDGSTDESVAIAQHYAEKDDRLRVIAASHQGIAPALKSAIGALQDRNRDNNALCLRSRQCLSKDNLQKPTVES